MSGGRTAPPTTLRGSSPAPAFNASGSVAPAARSTPPGQDPYADLLRETRGLRRDQAQAREQWIQSLPGDRREDVLFEFEIALKGLACFANPRNHPGPARRAAIVAQDYLDALFVAHSGMQRALNLCRLLLGSEDRAFVFQRYLETLLPHDGARTRLVEGSAAQDTPQESLLELRRALTNSLEVVSGITRLPHVPFRLFYATLTATQREISHSTFFNPLSALEFRPEFDRIANPRVLELMRQVRGEPARRLVALTFLSLFRMLRYVALLERLAQEPNAIGPVFLVASVLRSDARALTTVLRKHGGEQLAAGFERELFEIPASQIGARYDEMQAEAHRLFGVKATLGGVAANLRLEIKRAFEHDLQAPTSTVPPEVLRAQVASVVANLRPALQNAILVLGTSLGERLDEHGVFDDLSARRSLSSRLRRDVWMFAQIVRAFALKARATPSREVRWTGPSSLEFVQEFLAYFNAMGYPLLRAADYPRVDAFIRAMSSLQPTDLVDPERLKLAVSEAETFYDFLSELFERIGGRDELRDVPFDRRAAAEALRLYLND